MHRLQCVLAFVTHFFGIIHTTWKESVFGVFLVRIFPHSDWMRRDTEYLFVFHPNARKYGPEKIPYLDTSRSGKPTRRYTLQWMLPWLFINYHIIFRESSVPWFCVSPSKILIILSIPLLLCIVKNWPGVLIK